MHWLRYKLASSSTRWSHKSFPYSLYYHSLGFMEIFGVFESIFHHRSRRVAKLNNEWTRPINQLQFTSGLSDLNSCGKPLERKYLTYSVSNMKPQHHFLCLLRDARLIAWSTASCVIAALVNDVLLGQVCLWRVLLHGNDFLARPPTHRLDSGTVDILADSMVDIWDIKITS